MNLVELMEIYQMNHKTEDITGVFEDVTLDERLNLKLLGITIINEWGTAEPICNTTNTFKIMSDAWFERNKDNITRKVDAIVAEYKPLENYDRTETHTVTKSDNITDTTKTSSETKTSAFNENDYQPSNLTEDSANTGRTANGSENINMRVHGNIGVTTNQQMLRAELDIRNYDIYKDIANNWARSMMYHVS